MQPNLRLLGRFELALPAGQPLTIAGARAQLVLARLALAEGGTLDRATLGAMLWGDRAEAQARASLRQVIWSLRQELKASPEALVTSGEMVALDRGVVSSDVARFEGLARSGNLADLDAALALYRGDLLEGIDLATLDPEGYFLAERSRLRDLALQGTRALASAYAKTARWDEVVRTCRRGLGLDPYDAALHGQLVAALHRLGRPREARDQDEAFRSRMKSELGLSLPPQTRPASGQPATPSAATLAPAPRRSIWTAAAAAGLLAIAAALVLWPAPSPDVATTLPVSEATGLPSRSLEAYDLYLRAEAARLAAVQDTELRSVMAEFRRSSTLDPGFAAPHAGFALIAADLWQRSLDRGTPSLAARVEAYEAAGKALALDADNARALAVLSRIQAEDGALDTALVTARRAVERDPLEAEARANLAILLANQGDYTHARAELTLLQRLGPAPRPEWMLTFGQIAFADGRYDAAIADLVALWPRMPDNVQLLQHLAAALALQGRIRQANTIRDRLLIVMPGANLHLTAARLEGRRSPRHIERLIEGLRRSGLPEWPQGFVSDEGLRLDDAALTALVEAGDWQGLAEDGANYSQVGATLCRSTADGLSLRPLCGPVYRAAPDQSSGEEFVFVAADAVRAFSLAK